MRRFWEILSFICLLLSAQHLYPQSERFRLLDTGSGLYNNQVRFLVQLQDGKILAYTEGMFNLYDGYRFKPLACDLDHTLPLGMHNICTAYDGGDGLLWAKDYFRLYLFDTRTQRFCQDIKARFEVSGMQEPMNDFILDQDKNAWIITESGKLYCYDWKHPAQLVYSPTREERADTIRVKDVMQAGPFHLIFLNTGKMLCWEGKTQRMVGEDYTVATPYPSEYFRTAWIQADEQHLLISVSHTEGYLYSYNYYTREWKEILRGRAINDIRKCADGSFWLGGNYTLIHLSADFKVLQETNTFRLADNREVKDFVMSLLIDSRQGLWLGMGSCGILKAIRKEKHAEYYVNTEATHNEGRMIRSLCRYDRDHLLAGSMQGVFLFNTAEKRFRPFLPGFSDLCCTDVKRDSRGRFWLSTRNGLYCLPDSASARYRKISIPGAISSTVRFSLPLQDGNILACVELKDLYLYNPEDGTARRLNDRELHAGRIRAMSFAAEIRPGSLLIGSQNGLFCYDLRQDKATRAEFVAPFEKYSIKYNCVYTAGDTVWLGTQDGLVCYDLRNGRGRRFDTDDGLPNNCIQSIAAAPDGSLWVSTSNGIGHLRTDDRGHFSIARMEKDDGIQDGEMMEQSMAVMPDGRVYIGGINGITELPPRCTDYGNRRLVPSLVGLRVMDHVVDNKGLLDGRLLLPEGMSFTKTLELEHNENFLEMQFSALDYDSPGHMRYRYRLDGVDQAWNHTAAHTGICTATYTSLSPGTYTLQVQAAMEYAEWGETAKWQIVIAPPLWKTWWAYALYALAAAGLICYAVGFYLAYKRSQLLAEQELLKRQKEQYLDELKFRFFTNISHEFRTPLALIITPLELLVRETADSGLKTRLEKILGNARDLLRLVNQLLDFRRLEQKGEQLKVSVVQIKRFIEESVSHFNELAQEYRITLSCECRFTPKDTFTLDAEKIKRVLNNLVSNAVKFTPDGGTVSVQAGWNGTGPADGIYLRVSDTGIGIRPEDLDNIFERFFQGSQPQPSGMNTGSGIGLHLTQGYVKLHKGTITVESTPGKGSTFTVTLPAADSQSAAPDTTAAAPAEQETANPETGEGKKKDITLLVVEDNAQFRTFLKDLLKAEFNILTAKDGEKGLEKAQECYPDLIISDVMMPNMDGYAFCRAIKDDPKCHHIPVILLTARDSAESRSGAYDAGADSFIAKPFDIDVLTSRINQLLEQRERRQAAFWEEMQLPPKNGTIAGPDERFIREAIGYVEKNMGNPEYNVESLSADMNTERTAFYRKMQAIVGQTPTEFIRSVRLKRAARLLEKGEYTVQEISWMVGFNTPRYFSAYFKEMFGMTPSQYAARKTAEGKAGGGNDGGND